MRTTTLALAAVLAVMLSAPAGGQQITKVGIIDIARVYTAFFRDSQAVAELERLRSSIQKEIAAVGKEIASLEERKLAAMREDNKDQVARLDRDINDRRQYVNTYRVVKNRELDLRILQLQESTQFIDQVLAAITYVAESEGFALILRKATDSDQFLFWVPEIDITQKVIMELLKRAGKAPSGGE